MNTIPESTDALTVPGDLNATPWIDTEGKREFSRQLGLALLKDDWSFPDTVPVENLN
jgi:hypothetical protein